MGGIKRGRDGWYKVRGSDGWYKVRGRGGWYKVREGWVVKVRGEGIGGIK